MENNPEHVQGKNNITLVFMSCAFIFYLGFTNIEKYRNIPEKKYIYIFYCILCFMSLIVGATSILIMFDTRDN